MKIAPDGEKAGILRGGGEARQARQGRAVNSKAFIGQRADDKGFRAEMVELGGGIMGDEALAFERLQQTVDSRLGEFGLLNGLAQPDTAPGTAGDDAQQCQRAVQALRSGCAVFGHVLSRIIHDNGPQYGLIK